MSVKYLNQAFSANIKKSSHKFIYVALADYANEVGEAYPSTETICKKTSLDRKTVFYGLKALCDLGFILDTGQKRGKTNQVRVWQITIPKTEQLNHPENGTLKGAQKRNSTENGTVPFLPTKLPENGTLKGAQKRNIEPSVLLTTSKPSVKENINTKEKKEKPAQKTKPPAKRFIPPTEAEVEEYAAEKDLFFDGWLDHWLMRNWVMNNGKKLSDWRAAMRTWNRNHKNWEQQRNAKNARYNQQSGERISTSTRCQQTIETAYAEALAREQAADR